MVGSRSAGIAHHRRPKSEYARHLRQITDIEIDHLAMMAAWRETAPLIRYATRCGSVLSFRDPEPANTQQRQRPRSQRRAMLDGAPLNASPASWFGCWVEA
jgi:hypothetical protein